MVEIEHHPMALDEETPFLIRHAAALSSSRAGVALVLQENILVKSSDGSRAGQHV